MRRSLVIVATVSLLAALPGSMGLSDALPH